MNLHRFVRSAAFPIVVVVLLAFVAAALLSGCGGTKKRKPLNAYAFCGPHGGVIEQTWQPNGNVYCFDGSYYNPNRGLAFAGFFLHHRKGTRPVYNRFAARRAIQQNVRRYRQSHPQARPVRSGARPVRPRPPSSGNSSGGSRPSSSGGGSRSSSGGSRRR